MHSIDFIFHYSLFNLTPDTKRGDTMGDKHLLYNVDDHIAVFTINREKQRNAISVEAIGLFMEYLDRAEVDEEVRVVCITGAGDRAFCSGADLGGAVSHGGQDIFLEVMPI